MRISDWSSDVCSSDLLWHYLTVGLPQGKEPIEFFDSQYYLAQYSDVERHVRTGAITTPLAHFLHYGASENRRPGPELDPATLSNMYQTLIDKVTGRGIFGVMSAEGRILGRRSEERRVGKEWSSTGRIWGVPDE